MKEAIKKQRRRVETTICKTVLDFWLGRNVKWIKSRG